MARLNHFTTFTLVLFTLALTGCGGTGGGSKSGGLTGSVTGKVAVASLPSGDGTATISLDGTNISVPAAADGSFTLPNIPSGVYTLVVRSSQSAGEVVVVVSGGSVTNVGAIDLVAAGQVTGLVSDSVSGVPIAGATVTVSDAATATATADQPPLPVRGTTTDGSGSYTVEGLPAGSYLVTISKQGYMTGTLEVTVTAGSTAVGDIRLVAVSVGSGTMQGKVTETNSDGSTSPLGGVFVILSPNSGGVSPVTVPVPPTATGIGGGPIVLWPAGPISPDYYAYTAGDGTYSITGVPAGGYTATAIRPGFQTATQSVTISQGQTSPVNFTLSLFAIPTGIVTGTVTDASTSMPISGATVTAIIYGATPLASSSARARPSAVAIPGGPAIFNVTATTDANGKYNLVVPTSTNAIFCSADGYTSNEQSISVTSGSTSTVNFALAADTNQTATISGTVSEADPVTSVLAPVAGATVTIMTTPLLIPGAPTPPSGPAIATYTATTDANGNYSTSIPVGVYQVTAVDHNATSGPLYVRMFTNMTENLTLIPSDVVPPPVPNLKT